VSSNLGGNYVSEKMEGEIVCPSCRCWNELSLLAHGGVPAVSSGWELGCSTCGKTIVVKVKTMGSTDG